MQYVLSASPFACSVLTTSLLRAHILIRVFAVAEPALLLASTGNPVRACLRVVRVATLHPNEPRGACVWWFPSFAGWFSSFAGRLSAAEAFSATAATLVIVGGGVRIRVGVLVLVLVVSPLTVAASSVPERLCVGVCVRV